MVGEDAGISQVLATLELRPVVVEQLQEALWKRQDLSSSPALFNLPRGTIEPRFLHALSKDRTRSPSLVEPHAPYGKVSLKKRGSPCALAGCTMATFRGTFVAS